MNTAELDGLKLTFENALQHWIQTIKQLQVLLAESKHTARSEDVWQQADFDQEEARKAVEEARRAYEDAVRRANFSF